MSFRWWNSYVVRKPKKMQLDIDMSPPANIMTLRLGLTHLTFDLDPRDLWRWPMTLNITCKVKWDHKSHFWTSDLWPWPSRSTFDLDPCNLWPPPMWPLTSKITWKMVKWVWRNLGRHLIFDSKAKHLVNLSNVIYLFVFILFYLHNNYITSMLSESSELCMETADCALSLVNSCWVTLSGSWKSVTSGRTSTPPAASSSAMCWRCNCRVNSFDVRGTASDVQNYYYANQNISHLGTLKDS